MNSIIITSSDLRPGCRDLSTMIRLDPTVKRPDTLALRQGLLRHDVRRQCHRSKQWPPTREAMEAICKHEWLARYHDLMEDDYRAVRDHMLASVNVAELWPALDSILACEDWMPSVDASSLVEHRGELGWNVKLGVLKDGTPVYLRSRFDLAHLDPDNVSRGILTDTKGASGDYEYQADHNALGAFLLWDGIPDWEYRAVYLGSDRRPQVFTYDADKLAKVCKALMAEAARIHTELKAGGATPTPCDNCDWCPKAGACPAFQGALVPLETGPAPIRFPGPGELPTLPDADLIELHQVWEPMATRVEKYDKALGAALKARLKESKAPLIARSGKGLRLSQESGGSDVSDAAAFVALVQKHGLKLDDCINPVWGEVSRGLNKYVVEADRLAAIAEFDALKVPKKPKEVLRPAKEAA